MRESTRVLAVVGGEEGGGGAREGGVADGAGGVSDDRDDDDPKFGFILSPGERDPNWWGHQRAKDSLNPTKDES